MKKKMKKLLVLLLSIIMLLSMSGCTSDKSQIKDALSEFEYSCQNLDVDAMLACIDPDIADPIRFGVAVYSQVQGDDYEDVMDGILECLITSQAGESVDSEAFFSTISFSDEKIEKKKAYANVACKVNFEMAGEQFTRDANIQMVKRDDKWYVVSFDMFS